MGSASVLEPGQWWRQPFSMLQTNLREIDADMDVDKVADYIRDYGASAWLTSIGGIQAQYPTELAFHSANQLVARRATRDLTRDALDAAHARGLRLLARMDFSKVSAKLAAENPDWCYTSPLGNLQEHSGDLVSVCPCGPWYQERMFDILDEVTRRYPVDGFFINWTSMNEFDYYKRIHGCCQCSNCQARWHAWSGGLELPTGADSANYSRWLSFSHDVIEDITARVRAFIAERLPDACLILGRSADIMFHEANNAVGRELWHHATSETVSGWISYRPEVPVLVNSTTFMDMPYRMASEEPAHFAQYLLQCIARGGNPSTYMMGPPGRIPYLCMDVGKEITQFHRRWRGVYEGLRPCAKTGLVRPDRAQMTARQYDEALSEFRGFYSAMAELHVLFDVLGQEHLPAMAQNGGLKRYEAIVLPNLGRLSADAVEPLDSWVEAGGRLIATGSTAIAENGTTQLKSLPSTRQRAVVNKRELLWSSYLAPPQKNADEHAYTGPIVPLYGSYHLFEWKKDTSGRYKMLARAAFSPPEKAYGNVQVEQRGCAIGDFGKGKGVVIPFTVGRAYRELGLGVYRDFYAEILREEGGVQEEVSCEIAEQVEVTINVNTAGKTVVHLINMSGARKQNFGSHIPVVSGTIKVPEGKAVRAQVLSSDTELEVKDGKITLPQLDLFEVVVIEGL